MGDVLKHSVDKMPGQLWLPTVEPFECGEHVFPETDKSGLSLSAIKHSPVGPTKMYRLQGMSYLSWRALAQQAKDSTNSQGFYINADCSCSRWGVKYSSLTAPLDTARPRPEGELIGTIIPTSVFDWPCRPAEMPHRHWHDTDINA